MTITQSRDLHIIIPDIDLPGGTAMDTKLPYYAAYPMPLIYDDERRERRDFEYMKSMYPNAAKKLLPYIEDECDRMEYEGSMMFDEYPDHLQLMLMGRRIAGKAKAENIFSKAESAFQAEKDQEGNVFHDLIQVMLYQEIYKRRCDHRRYCREYYPGMKIK